MRMKKSPKEISRAFWNDVYSAEGYAFGTEPNAWFARQDALLKSGQRILMVADGDGRNSIWCAQKGMRVDAFDLSDVAVEKARQLAGQVGAEVSFTVGGIDDWDWQPDCYDAVAIILCQFATPSMNRMMFGNSIRTLKKGGLLFVLGYDVKQLEYKTGGPPWKDRLYTTDILQELADGTEILELESWETEIDAGRHKGLSAFVSMVARKK